MADVDIIARLKLAGDSFNREFRTEMTRAESEAKKSANRMRSSLSALKGAAVGFVSGIGVEEIARVIGNTVNKIDDLGDAAQRLGVSAKFLQRFEYAAISMDATVEQARDGLGKFNKVVGDYINGNKSAAKALEETLGVQVEVNGKVKTAEQLLYDVSDAVAKLPTQYQKATAVQKIFGKGAEDLIPLLAGGSANLRKFGDDLERAGGAISDEDVKRIGDMKQEWDQFSVVLQGKVAKAVAGHGKELKGMGEDIKALVDLISDLVGWLDKGATSLDRFANSAMEWGRGFGAATGLNQIGPAIKGMIGMTPGAVTPAPKPRVSATAGKGVSANVWQGAIRASSSQDSSLIVSQFAPQSAVTQEWNQTMMEIRASWAAMATSSATVDTNTKTITGKLGDMLATMREQADLDLLRAQGLDEQASLIEELRAVADEVNSLEGLTNEERQAGVEILSQQLLVSRGLVKATEQASKFAQDFADNYGAGDLEKVVEQIDRESDYRREKYEEESDLQKQNAAELADMYETLLSDGIGGVWSDFKRQGKRIISEIAAQWTLAMLSGQKFSLGSLMGTIGNGSGGALGTLLSASGLFGNATGSGSGVGNAASAAASVAGMAGAGPIGAGIALNQGIGKALGLGQVKGGLMAALAIGPILASVFGSAKRGSATLGFSNGELGVVSSSGNNKSRVAAAKDGVGTIADQLRQIADAVGGSLDGPVSVSLGIRKKSYRVDPTGRGRVKGAGVLDFGEDQAAAIEAALRDALSDGVITGISEASRRILNSGKDLQKSIEKAVAIEQIPKLLRERLDPVGAAVEAVDKKFATLVGTLKEAGATAAQIDQARQLYQLERADALSTQGGSTSLKSFLDSFKTGGSSPYSLRTQRSNAQSALEPFLAQIAAGSAIDVEKYLTAAQTFLDIERQLEGSRPGYFASLDRIQNATNQAIAQIDGQSKVGTTDPFAELTAQATQATANLTEQSNALLAQVLAQLGNIGGLLGSGGSFIGADRGFVSLG